MTSRYRVEYALKAHRRDALIEFIKGLLAVPFVLHSQPTSTGSALLPAMAAESHRRYREIMKDIEGLVNDHILCDDNSTPERSKLRFLVPTVGRFFTPLLLEKAFIVQDHHRAISSRRFVAPSFNDIRLILNTAQIMSLTTDYNTPKLVTFDGDVTLYDDGQCLVSSSPVIPNILALLARDINIGIVTAAGYTDGARYFERLHGLLEAIRDSAVLTKKQKESLIILGGESSYMFQSAPEEEPTLLRAVARDTWALEEMKAWTEGDINHLLDLAETALRDSVVAMRLNAVVLRKERAVGIVHGNVGGRFAREQLEEAVLAVQRTLEMTEVGQRLPFCAFNGGNDVFVDIGDKRLGVLCCQTFFGQVTGKQTLHIGDQFLSAGHNDFKARMAGTTVWVANPTETVACLAELIDLMENGLPKMSGVF